MTLTPPHKKSCDLQSLKRKIRALRALGFRGLIKSVYFNYRILPFGQAIRLPILLSRYTAVCNCRRNSIIFDGQRPGFGCLRFGLNDLQYSYESKSFINIRGQLKIYGSGYHLFGPGVSLNIWEGGVLSIGNNFSVAPHLRIFVSKAIEIGDNNMWSFYNLVMDTDAHPIYNRNGCLINNPQKIVFGNKCWLGAYCKILKGADIPDGSIIGAGSTITKVLSNKNSIYIGHRIHKEDVIWESSIL